MSLKYKVEKIEDVEEQFRSLYVADDSGAFILQVEGATSKAKVDEFRGNNVTLQTELDALKQERAEEIQKLKDAETLKNGNANELLATKDSRIQELEGLLGTKDAALSTFEERFKTELAGIVEQLPEEMRGNYEGIDTQRAIKLAGDTLTLLSTKKPFGIPPKGVGKLVNSDDLSETMSGAELLEIHRKKGQGA